MYWDISQSALNANAYHSFEVTWIRSDPSVLFSSVAGGVSPMFAMMDHNDVEHNVAKPLFAIKKTVCSGTTSVSWPVYHGLRALNPNPNPSSTNWVGNPWRVRKNVWIPIISGVRIIDTDSTKELWVEFVAIVNPDLVEEINSTANLPVEIIDKIAGTPGTGECF
jgi:hypothetical protein